jgi:hypothetical protein
MEMEADTPGDTIEYSAYCGEEKASEGRILRYFGIHAEVVQVYL